MKEKPKTIHDQGFLIASVFKDIDHFAEVGRKWNVDFRQLEPGLLDARLLQVATDTVQLMEARFDRRIEQQGCSPAGSTTIAVPLASDPKLVWRQRQVPTDSVLIYRPGSEIDGASRPGFHVVAVSIEDAEFTRIAMTLDHPEVIEFIKNNEVASLSKATMQRLQSDLRRMCSTFHGRPTGSISSRHRRILERRLPALMIRTLAESLPSPHRHPITDRQRALQAALDFIYTQPHDAVTVRDLCRATGNSERVLQYAFRSHFDITPGAYLKATRLASIRRQLRQSSPQKGTISNLANEWGFWHMGQFAADYRLHFGELPSETLHRHVGSL